MNHKIEISTVDALLIVQLLHDNYLENDTDKLIAERLRNEIIEKVCKELSEQQVAMQVIKKIDDTTKTNWCVCPVCFKGLGWEHTESAKSRYCPKCGQKLRK